MRKITSLPADMFGIKDRGSLEKGKAADILIFDYQRIKSDAVFFNPKVKPEGIDKVIVNGRIVVDRGEFVGQKLSGKLIRRA